jgi:hypothetical protein
MTNTSDDTIDFHESYDLLNDGSRRQGRGNREKLCNTCGDWIDLGTAETGDIALTNHEGRKRCLAKAESKRQKHELSATATALEDLRCSGSISPRTPRPPHYRRQRRAHFLAILPYISCFLHVWIFPIYASLQYSPKHHCVDNRLLRSTTSLVNNCPGIPLIWDAEDPLAIFRNYPWTRHGFNDHPLGYQFPTANYEGEDIIGFDIV